MLEPNNSYDNYDVRFLALLQIFEEDNRQKVESCKNRANRPTLQRIVPKEGRKLKFQCHCIGGFSIAIAVKIYPSSCNIVSIHVRDVSVYCAMLYMQRSYKSSIEKITQGGGKLFFKYGPSPASFVYFSL